MHSTYMYDVLSNDTKVNAHVTLTVTFAQKMVFFRTFLPPGKAFHKQFKMMVIVEVQFLSVCMKFGYHWCDVQLR